MSWALRIVLIAFAIAMLAFVIRRISKGKLLMADATFWFLFALCLVALAVFPQIAFALSDVLGVESPANIVFLLILSILLFRELHSTMRISKLNNQVASLAQEQALRDVRNAPQGKDAQEGATDRDGNEMAESDNAENRR